MCRISTSWRRHHWSTLAARSSPSSGRRRRCCGRPVPVIAVVAVRTGAGKSQTSRRVCSYLRSSGTQGRRCPSSHAVRRSCEADACSGTQPLTICRSTTARWRRWKSTSRTSSKGTIIYAGVDYDAILRQAEKEADVIVWDGGNNDTSFYTPDLTITVVDPHRPGHELQYYPGATNVRLADVVVVNKVDSATAANVDTVVSNVSAMNPGARVILATSPITVDDPLVIKGKTRPRDRRWSDVDAWRDAVRRGDPRGPPVWRRRDHRSASVRRPHDRGNVRESIRGPGRFCRRWGTAVSS